MKYIIGELIDIAIKMEREGIAFYKRLSKLVNSEETREIFLGFAAEEEKHADLFQKMKKVESNKTAIEDSELISILNEINLQEVLPEPKEKSVEKIHPLNAIKIGMKAEKSTVKFYKKLSGKLKDNENRDILSGLIKEEKRHYEELKEMHITRTFSI
jgi:rubrerythrin